MSDYESCEESSIEEEVIEDNWNNNFQEAIKIINYNEKFPERVKTWIFSQLNLIEKQQLNEEEKKKFLEVPEFKILYENRLKRKKWIDIYCELRNFVNLNERLPKWTENERLIKWLGHQKEHYIKGRMESGNYRLEMLFKIKGVKEFFDRKKIDLWEKKFKKLKEFINLNETLPSDSKNALIYEKKLARWLSLQIQVMKGNREWKMKEERKIKLLQIELIAKRFKN
jgi:hypothetical protein